MNEEPRGHLALIGGEEFDEACRDVDTHLIEASGADEVLVVPTAAAFENPGKVVEQAEAHFGDLGVKVAHAMVLHHAEADDDDAVAAVGNARFVYLTGGSPMHLRSVLLRSKLWDAIQDAHRAGATLAASGSGAVVLCNPMIDPRGGAYTVGLGLVSSMTVFPHHDTVAEHLWERAVDLRPAETVLVGVDEHTAAVRDPGGAWHVVGPGRVTLDTADGSESQAAGPLATLTI